jgi:hypothetical protein
VTAWLDIVVVTGKFDWFDEEVLRFEEVELVGLSDEVLDRVEEDGVIETGEF